LEINIQDANLHGKRYGTSPKGPPDNFHQTYAHYDLALNPEFMTRIQIHHDMNFNPEMFINKLQMLASTAVSNKHKFSWFIQWNESNVLKEANKIPKQGFSNTTVDQLLHKATF